MFRTLSACGVLVAAVTLTACEASKSSTPLSPTVAGPIPGIEISAPRMLEPTSGTKISVEKQPVTLLIENAGSNGPRPLSYSFDIATDTGFGNLVFSRDVAQGEGGRTSLRMTDTLPTGRTYYWRVRAQDGANTGPYATPAAFTIFTPIVIDVPGLSVPAPNSTVLNLRPTFTIANSPRSGPVGAMTYLFELADGDSFSNKVATWSVSETPNQTTTVSPADLTYGKVYYWHVRPYDPTTLGPWSNTQAFQMLEAPAPVYTPGPPVPSGPAPNDAINLNSAIIHNSPADVASWPVTTTITRLNLMPSGAHIEFSKQASWPEVVPPGWAGGLQYTLWIVLNINGQWHASGCIEYWRGLYESGGPVSGYSRDWYYDPIRWGPMAGHQPAPGEQVGFLVTSGDARNNGPSSVRERSNVVMVSFPSNAGQSFVF